MRKDDISDRRSFVEDFHNVENDVVTDKVAESQRSHRMVEAEFADVIDVFFGSNAFHQSLDSFVQHRDDDTVASEAREVVNFDRCFAEVFRSLSIFSYVSSEVAMPLMTSINFMTGAGLKKCMPMTLSGRFVAAPIWVIARDEVLDARIVCSGQSSSSSLKIAD